MIKKTLAPPACAVKENTSLFVKKCMVFFILTSMFVNGFVSGIHNVNGYSFVMILIGISKNATVQSLSKCGGSLLSISNKICIDMLNAIIPSSAANQGKERKKEERKRNNTSNDYAVISNISKQFNKRTHSDCGGQNFCLAGCFALTCAFIVCGRRCRRKNLAGVVFLFFIVFIASIRRRKIKEVLKYACMNCACKRRVSA